MRYGTCMIHITLGDKRPVDPSIDELQRDTVGFSEDMTDAELYTANHGCWRLGPRAERERFMLASYGGIVRQAVEIEAIEPVARGGRSVIHGEILSVGHPVYDKFVGQPSPVQGVRNPITYIDDDLDEARCLCGCGEGVVGRDFLPGHDQIAIHARIKQIGSVPDFLAWFDEVRRPWASDTEKAR
jgi:hypothetical protein